MNRIQLRVQAESKLRNDRRSHIMEDAKNDIAYLADVLHNISAKITGAGNGTFPLTKSSGNKSVGMQSFDSDKLDAGQHMVIDAACIEFGEALKADNKKPSEVGFLTAPTAEFLAADVVLKQGNELFRMPVSELCNTSVGVSRDDAYRMISHMPIVEASKVFSVYLEFPEGVSLPANAKDYFVKFSVRAHQLRK